MLYLPLQRVCQGYSWGEVVLFCYACECDWHSGVVLPVVSSRVSGKSRRWEYLPVHDDILIHVPSHGLGCLDDACNPQRW